ncbi:hypothetical protein AK830_g11757 [Neonectria ditissima]|uniref:Aminoglycoside phosphotransferase domain-containing protein n=1 Tax=Neonectria ditissima TaxID=78410 RepID=A0A0P7B4K7_9HYPO|nr:hypothetical protein AK830_g11757 [Neonectria ditissima]
MAHPPFRLYPVTPASVIPPTLFVETMNPERARMLADAATEASVKPSAVATAKDERMPLPLVTGANRAPVGDAWPRAVKQTPAEPVKTPSAGMNSDKPGVNPVKALPPATTSKHAVASKRSYAEFSKDEDTVYPLPRMKTVPSIPSLGPVPKPSDETNYLSSLLKHRELKLTLRFLGQDGNDCRKTYTIQISDVGLLHHQTLSSLQWTRALSLPSSNPPGDSHASAATEEIRRYVEGELLEDVWAGLSSQMKYDYALQLGKIVEKLRSYGGGADKRGSVQSEKHVLFLDKHANHTYYAVRRNISAKQFTAFLVSTFHQNVPARVAQSLSAAFVNNKGKYLMTHANLCPKNIVVNGGKIAWILGWDCAGYYPNWWEYAKFFEATTREENQDWYEYAGVIFAVEYPIHLAAYQGIARCQQS